MCVSSQTGSGQKGPAVDQSPSVLPLRSAKSQDFGELWRENVCTCLGLFHLKLARTGSFQPARRDKWKATLASHPSMDNSYIENKETTDLLFRQYAFLLDKIAVVSFREPYESAN